MILSRSRRHLRRYREIARVLAKHGWGWMLERVGLAEHIGLTATERESSHHAPVHLREMLEELGPTFIKLGQLLSTRPDVVPQSYIDELSKLQDTAPTLIVDIIYNVIESEFGEGVDELFKSFNPVPLAAASLAQVHCAKLHDGTPVIVKVQRPNIRDVVETDIEILYNRARFLEKHSDKARIYGVMEVVDEFAMTIREELDYTREGRNTDRLREQLSHLKYLHIPRVYWELTTAKVLTLEQMQGIKITDIVRCPLPGVDPKDVATKLACAFLEQVFVEGFFHADPHPGNILVTRDGEIDLVDCGQVGNLDAENKAGAVRMLMAFEQRDTRVLADEILNLGITQDEVDVRRLTLDLNKVLRTYYDLPARSVNMGQLLMQVLKVSAAHRIRLPVIFAVVGKVFTNIDGICRQLDPDFNLTRLARDYVGKAVRRELSTEGSLTELYRATVALRTFLLSLPANLERLTRRAVEGALRVEVKTLGLEEASHSIHDSANRISIALIITGMIIGSSLIASASRGRGGWLGVPILGIFGYIVATIFGIWLIISIVKSGRHRHH